MELASREILRRYGRFLRTRSLRLEGDQELQ